MIRRYAKFYDNQSNVASKIACDAIVGNLLIPYYVL